MFFLKLTLYNVEVNFNGILCILVQVNRATKKSNFEVASQEDYEHNDSDDDDETFDSVCVLCDNGGEVLWCAHILFVY